MAVKKLAQIGSGRNPRKCRYPGCARRSAVLEHCRVHLPLVAHNYSPALEVGYGDNVDADPTCGIYVISAGDTAVKVGKSGDVQGRLQAMQTASPLGLSVCFYMKAGEADAAHLEFMVHEALKRRGLHMRGEWFDTSPEVAIRTIRLTALKQGISLS